MCTQSSWVHPTSCVLSLAQLLYWLKTDHILLPMHVWVCGYVMVVVVQMWSMHGRFFGWPIHGRFVGCMYTCTHVQAHSERIGCFTYKHLVYAPYHWGNTTHTIHPCSLECCASTSFAWDVQCVFCCFCSCLSLSAWKLLNPQIVDFISVY